MKSNKKMQDYKNSIRLIIKDLINDLEQVNNEIEKAKLDFHVMRKGLNDEEVSKLLKTLFKDLHDKRGRIKSEIEKLSIESWDKKYANLYY